MTIHVSNAAKVETFAQAFSDRLAGRVVLSGNEGWDLARQAWNRAVDQRSAAVALPESAQDVLAVVEFAQAHGLAVAPQGTGHGALPLGPLDETILLNTARMRGVQIDPAARRARVQAGELWGEVAAAAVLPLFMQHSFGWTALQNGYLFTYVGIAIVLMRGGLAGQLVKRWGERSLLIAGLLMLAVGLALLTWSTNLALLLIALGIVSAGDGVVTPMVATLLSFASPPGAQGETLGLAQGVAGLGRVLGPPAAGSIFALGGPGAPFLFGSALVVPAALIALPALSIKHGVSLMHSTPDAQTVSTAQDRS